LLSLDDILRAVLERVDLEFKNGFLNVAVANPEAEDGMTDAVDNHRATGRQEILILRFPSFEMNWQQ
jgi:hypothetical protein